MNNERKSFVEVLGATAPKRQSPHVRLPYLQPIKRGHGTTDTLPQATRPLAQAGDAYLDAVVHRKNKPILNPSNLYLLEDDKSRAGTSYKQVDYVVVTREKLADASQIGILAQRAE